MHWLNKLCFTLAFVAMHGAASAEWHAAETRHFIIYSEGSERQISDFAERLESIDGLMRMATAIPEDVDPVKVRIYLVDSTDEVQRALGLSGQGIAGFYDSNALGPYAVSPRKTYDNGLNPQLILYHEYAHHFMLQYFPSNYPGWYVEGFAELIGSTGFLSNGSLAYGKPAKHRGDWLSFNWVPVQELLLKDSEKLKDVDIYGQGWALTHFLSFSPERAPQMRRYLQALQAGKRPEEAAKAFGDLSALNQAAHAYLRSGSFPYRSVPVKIDKPVIQKMRPLSPGEAALIPETIAFRDDDILTYGKEYDRKREAQLRAETLRKIQDKAARFPSDAFALYLLAEAEYAAANHAKSEAAADRLLAIQPDHVRGRVKKAQNMLHAAMALQGSARKEKAAEARRLITSANKASPDDPHPLIAYYQSFQMAGEAVPAIAVTGLMQAVATLPRDLAVRQMLVDALVSKRRWAEAAHYLRPISDASHASPRREAARKQMAEILAELAKEQPTQKAS